MLRKAILLGIGIGTSVSLPMLYQSNPGLLHALIRAQETGEARALDAGTLSQQPIRAAASLSPAGRKVEIAADERGHYVSDFKINGRRIEAMIDTGATAVAFNLSTARRLGLQVRASDMKHVVNTANGKARATVVTVDRVEIGRITVNDVEALVLEDQALNSTLVGMTFLTRLKGFQVDSGTLLLVQ
ncbi:TIGR02281 family clan AA aspartic protease [Mesorhizobium sp. LHD-90]|uniref:TIGR02281 family clan AA aspartic protease n=1 Tax=Mesorhizobium sp. LHD-90 TaxID=3071414 RepID=UPI0027DEDEC9|nr:TIGR02281 family clan AA aspartic protease [Mesorhizobium sp. LHD-90]MDQ6434628.1 TIGR02281 family clan AA aspartic protease [Mesorhizobium sp. LHD-90]